MGIVWTAQDTETGKPVYLALVADGTVVQVPTEPEDVLLSAKAVAAESGLVIVLDGINSYREKGKTVLYTDDEVYENVNKWGVDVLIDRATMTVVDVRNREKTGIGPFVLDADHFVVSGHHDAGQKLLANFSVNDVVTVLDHAPDAPAEPDPGTSPAVASHRAVWVMCWPDSPVVDIAGLPDEVDEIRLAFLVGNAEPVGYGPYGGKDRLTALLKTFLAKRSGRFISWSVGGGGYTIRIPDVEAYAKRVISAGKDLDVPIGGINWDWEHTDFKVNATKCIAVSRRLKQLQGNGFYVSWSPNGQFKDDYRNALRDAKDVVDEIAQQFYDDDTGITYEEAKREVQIYCDLFGAAKVGVGMMIGSNPTRWTLAECIDYAARFKRECGVTVTNLWEGSHASTKRWAVEMEKAAAA